MWCEDCCATDGVHPVQVVDLDSDVSEVWEWNLCQRCLEEKGLWCEAHGANLLLHDPCVVDNAEVLMVMSVCENCVEARVRVMSPDEIAAHVAMMRKLLPEHLLQVLSLGSALERMDGDPDRAALYRLIVTAEMHNSTLEQTIQDLATQNLATA